MYTHQNKGLKIKPIISTKLSTNFADFCYLHSKKKKGKKKGVESIDWTISIMPTKEHNNTSSDDIKFSSLFSKDSTKSSTWNPSFGASNAAAHVHLHLSWWWKNSPFFFFCFAGVGK